MAQHIVIKTPYLKKKRVNKIKIKTGWHSITMIVKLKLQNKANE